MERRMASLKRTLKMTLHFGIKTEYRSSKPQLNNPFSHPTCYRRTTWVLCSLFRELHICSGKTARILILKLDKSESSPQRFPIAKAKICFVVAIKYSKHEKATGSLTRRFVVYFLNASSFFFRYLNTYDVVTNLSADI